MFLGLCVPKLIGFYVSRTLVPSSTVLCSWYPENEGSINVKLGRKMVPKLAPKRRDQPVTSESEHVFSLVEAQTVSDQLWWFKPNEPTAA